VDESAKRHQVQRAILTNIQAMFHDNFVAG
jgi:hypothetical protein